MYDFTILALPGAFASGVGASLDILSSAADLAVGLNSAVPRWRVCSTEMTVVLSNGMRVDAQLLPKKPRPDTSIWIVPGLNSLQDSQAIRDRFAQPDFGPVIAALRTQARSGGTVAACCSAVFLLQAAGLLAGKRVTTTWWLGGLLQQLDSSCIVDSDQMVIADGAIVSGGAAFAHIDLVIHLLASRFNPMLAEAVCRRMVIEGRRSQASYIVPTALANGNDLAARIVARFEAALPNPPSVAELAREFSMSTRTLSRHIKAATGRSVSTLIQAARVNRARVLLQTTKISVEQVAEQVGYTDTTALRRLMRRITKSTPRQFRPIVYDDR